MQNLEALEDLQTWFFRFFLRVIKWFFQRFLYFCKESPRIHVKTPPPIPLVIGQKIPSMIPQRMLRGISPLFATENVSALHGNCFHRHYFENVLGDDLFQFVLHEFLKSSIMFLHSQNIIEIAPLVFPNIPTHISPGIPFVFKRFVQKILQNMYYCVNHYSLTYHVNLYIFLRFFLKTISSHP